MSRFCGRRQGALGPERAPLIGAGPDRCPLPRTCKGCTRRLENRFGAGPRDGAGAGELTYLLEQLHKNFGRVQVASRRVVLLQEINELLAEGVRDLWERNLHERVVSGPKRPCVVPGSGPAHFPPEDLGVLFATLSPQPFLFTSIQAFRASRAAQVFTFGKMGGGGLLPRWGLPNEGGKKRIIFKTLTSVEQLC